MPQPESGTSPGVLRPTSFVGVVRQAMKLKIDLIVLEMFREEFGAGWTTEDDGRFWKVLCGRRGLRALVVDAKQLEALCHRISESPADRRYMKHRLRFLRLCVGLSCLEAPVRIFSKNLPHFFAKFAAELFTEMADRAELVLEENGPKLLKDFGETDGQSAVCNQDRASVGRASG